MSRLPRVLIVNADDFGQSDGVNRGVAEAFERGIVTSASLMVRWPAAEAAARYAAGHPRLGLGLHLDLGEWRYDAGDWCPVYAVVDTGDAPAVETEVAAQVAAFRRLTGRDPDHLDSHQHVHREPPVRDIVAAAAADLGVPLREMTPGVSYCGGFYGQTAQGEPYPEAITVANAVALVGDLTDGVTELGCHPGYDDGLVTMYRREREQEVRALTDPSVRRAIAASGVELRTFADIRQCLPIPGTRPNLNVTKE